MGNGATYPMLGVFENDQRAVIKAFNNPEGNLTLVNEYICYKLATVLQLPMPISGLCQCDEYTEDPTKCLSDRNYGCGFYSIYQEKNALLKLGIMKHVENLDIFYKLVVFDHLIYNKDRNPGNLLVEYKKSGVHISVIDHSHVFKNEAIWDENCFKLGIIESDYFDTDIMKQNSDLYSLFWQTITTSKDLLIDSSRQIRQQISPALLDNILSSVPNEWIVPDKDLKSLKEYILYRLAHLDDMCNIIYDYIKI